MKKITGFICLMSFCCSVSFAQTFTHADTLRGSNGAGRDWWDATKYDLHVKFNLEDSTISGYNIISFKVLKPDSFMQIDLQQPMVIDSIQLIGENEGYVMQHTFLANSITQDGNFKLYA